MLFSQLTSTEFSQLMAVVALALFLVWLVFAVAGKTRRRNPPSPPAFPFLGHLHLLKLPLFQVATSLSLKYGPVFSLRFGRLSFVFISSPAAIQECLSSHDIAIANRPKTVAYDRLSYGYTVFAITPYGQLWRVLRRHAVVGSLSEYRLRSSSVIREEEIQMIVRSLFRGGARRVDLSHLISVYVYNVMNRIIVGRAMIRDEDEVLAKKLIQESRTVLAPAPLWNVLDYFPFLRLIGFRGIEKGFNSWNQKRDKMLQNFISEFKQSSGMQPRSYIQDLIDQQKTEPEFFSDDLIKSQILVMFAAGRDTSTLVIGRTMYLLMTNPRVLQKLRFEIDSLVGHSRLIKESDIPDLRYLRCVVDESMRLYPTAPLLGPRCAARDITVSGYRIPKGTVILGNAWAVHGDPSLWERAGEFIPERFDQERGEGLSFKFLPFGIGRRACPAMNMGIRNISLGVGAFVQCFDWESAWDSRSKSLEAFCSPRPENLHLLSQL